MRKFLWFVIPSVLAVVALAQAEAEAAADNDRPAPGEMTVVSVTPLEVRAMAIRDYDFAMPLEKFTDLDFSQQAKPEKVQNEVRFHKEPRDPALVLRRINVPASDIRAIRLTLTAKRQTSQGETPVKVSTIRLYWARTQDVLPDGTWPFDEKRAMNFAPAAKDTPDMWVATPGSHQNWNGTVDQMFFSVKAEPEQPADTSEDLNIYLRRIEFLADRYDSPAP